MKKVLSVVLVFGLVCGAFAGCADSEGWTTFEGDYFKIDYPEGLIIDIESDDISIFEKVGVNNVYDFRIETSDGLIRMGILFDNGTMIPGVDNLEFLKRGDIDLMCEYAILMDSMQLTNHSEEDIFSETILSDSKTLVAPGLMNVDDNGNIYYIPLDGWIIVIWTSYTDSNSDIVNKMLDSFEITNYEFGVN